MKKEVEPNVEKEVSLIICSDNSKTLYDDIKHLFSISIDNSDKRIEKLSFINEYHLKFAKEAKIVDTYYDTPSCLLGQHQFALRLRNKDNVILITLKGPPKDNSHSISRSEDEYEWSMEHYKKIVKQIKESIKEMELDENDIDEKFVKDNPTKTLENIKLKDFQTRKTTRTVFNVTNKDEIIIAELDIDDVTYVNSDNQILARAYFVEIEIKNKFKDGDYFIGTIVDDLRREYGDIELKNWPYGKVSLGKEIEKMCSENKIGKFISKDHSLKCEAIDRIEKSINDKEKSST
jgi:adenylate cyclase class IV